jgi:hypothetical protein
MPKLDIFSANALGSLLLPTFTSTGRCSLQENPPSSSKNVNFANEQTYRILMPYVRGGACDCFFLLKVCTRNLGQDGKIDIVVYVKMS